MRGLTTLVENGMKTARRWVIDPVRQLSRGHSRLHGTCVRRHQPLQNQKCRLPLKPCIKQAILYDRSMYGTAILPRESWYQRIRSNRIFTGLAVYLCLLIVWVIFVHPALFNEWWSQDDLMTLARGTERYTRTQIINSFARGSRPLQTIVQLLTNAVLFHTSSDFTAGIVLRLIQGTMHVLCASIAGLLLARFTERKIAFLTVLPFLVWPFSHDATIWVSGIIYPLAALLSLLGILLLIGKAESSSARRFAGMFFIALSPFANQSSCLAGGVVFCMALALSRHHREHRSLLLHMLPYVLTAYTVGLALNIQLTTQAQDQRIANFSVTEVPKHMWEPVTRGFKSLLTTPLLYPPWLTIFQPALFAFALIAIFPLSSAQSIRHKMIGGVVVLLLGLSIVCIIRAPAIAIGSTWITERMMYLDPFLFSLAFCLILQAKLKPNINAMVSLLLLTVLIGAFLPISLTHAREHVTVYNRDVEELRRLEHIASQEQTKHLLLVTTKFRSSSVNPYSIRYSFGSPSVSSFTSEMFSFFFITYYSKTLVFNSDEVFRKQCADSCPKTSPPSQWTGTLQKPVKAICFCP